MKLQTKFGKAEVKNGKLKQVIEKQKLKSSQLAFAARQAKIQIEELGVATSHPKKLSTGMKTGFAQLMSSIFFSIRNALKRPSRAERIQRMVI